MKQHTNMTIYVATEREKRRRRNANTLAGLSEEQK